MIARHELALRLYAQRRTRDQVFRDYADGFGEPAWDLLLALYGWRGQAPIADLATMGGPFPMVTRRYVRWLETRELVRIDGGAAVLTMEGRRLIDDYLDRVWGAGDDAHGMPLI